MSDVGVRGGRTEPPTRFDLEGLAMELAGADHALAVVTTGAVLAIHVVLLATSFVNVCLMNARHPPHLTVVPE